MKIELEVEDVTGQMFLRQHIGEGEFEGEAVELTVILPTMSPYIKYKGTAYTVSIHDIVKAICKGHDNV